MGIHSHLGFIISPETQDEYLQMLKNIKNIPLMTHEAILKARAYTGLLFSQNSRRLSCFIRFAKPLQAMAARF